MRRGGLEVHTTIDPELQEVGLEAMRSTLPYSTDPSSALVSIDPRNGQIRAMVSSSDYDASQFNLAAQGHRQPGSTFKAFVLTTAIKQGIDPYSTYYTSKPLDLDLPQVGALDGAHRRRGLPGDGQPAAGDGHLRQHRLRPARPRRRPGKRWRATANSMGITTPLDGIPAEGIGGLRIGVSPLEMADAYATLASGGIHHNPVAIAQGRLPRAATSTSPKRPDPQRVLSPAVAYEVTRLLHDNITEGTGTAAYTGCAGQAGKTGTTDEYTDAWFAGYQPNLATVVWVGYPESNDISMSSVHGITVFGGTFPAEIWHSLYSGGGVPCEEFDEPEPADQLGAVLRPLHRRPSPSDSGCGGGGRGGGEAPPPGSAAVGGYDQHRPQRLRARGRAGTGCRCRRRRHRAVAGRLSAAASPPGAGSRASTPGLAYRPDVGWASPPTSASWSRRRGSAGGSSGGRSSSLVTGLRLAPVLLSHDVYSYVDYARLGVRPRPRPLRPPARSRRPADPAFAARHLDRSDQRLRAALHPRHLPARLAAGRRSRWRC